MNILNIIGWVLVLCILGGLLRLSRYAVGSWKLVALSWAAVAGFIGLLALTILLVTWDMTG